MKYLTEEEFDNYAIKKEEVNSWISKYFSNTTSQSDKATIGDLIGIIEDLDGEIESLKDKIKDLEEERDDYQSIVESWE